MRQTISLNFDWKFTPNFKDDYIKNDYPLDIFETVMIPHTNKELPYNNFNEKDYQFISSYKLNFSLPDHVKGQTIILHFGAVMTTATIFLNEKQVGFHEGGYTPFEINITDDVLYEGINYLFVKVDSHEIKDIPPFGNVVDFLTYGGIYREVSLLIRPNLYVKDLFIKTLEAPSLADNEMLLDISLNLNRECENQYHIKVTIFEEQKPILNYEINETFSLNHRFQGMMTEITRWDIDNPKLYVVELILYKDKDEIDRISQRVGFRTAAFTSEGFVLNNKKIKLIGLNRHQSYPYVGYAMPKRIQEKDAEILKFDLACNIVRTSHYMQSDHFINRCDEIGLLVMEEIPGWQYIGNEHFKDLSYQNVSDMITWHYNHPSIILWGVRINESPDDHDFYEKTAEIARKLDSDRPLGGVRNFKKSEMLEDIYTYNDFSHTGNNAGLAKPRKITGKLLPYLVTEHNGHLFPTKKFDHDEKRREHALRHLKVIDAAFQNDLISGVIGWCMNDYNTHIEFGSGDRICYHGVLDMFRIPKYAASVYASQQNKKPVLTVASNMTMGDHAKSMVPQTLVFTNCDYIKVYRNDTYIDTFYSAWDDFPSIPFAPIVVDDYVGNRILTEESYKPRIANRIKKVLITVNRNDLMSKIKNGFRMFNLTFLHKLTYADALHLYGKYIGDWGQEGGQYLFEGYIDDVCVISVKKGSNQSSVIQAIADDTSLNHSDTYDATRIVIRKVDEFGNDLVYANDVLNIETSEHLSVIGPKQLALIGGSVGIYVKTTGIKGEGFVKISVDNEAPIVLTFEIH